MNHSKKLIRLECNLQWHAWNLACGFQVYMRRVLCWCLYIPKPLRQDFLEHALGADTVL
eukprot:CAMPEP_0172657382 /NCGR_PEP_ID=MMETSP1074-20121228/2058_1 /TAXON_ID=2916 /ORGANISM="Ceratium fusus, Strain PA161109" /LENGTH=58 /DNA_ID=CAMNT_0013472453 /DNA_START=71 /DNA_END=244 /DNA_ORIENTATION=-